MRVTLRSERRRGIGANVEDRSRPAWASCRGSPDNGWGRSPSPSVRKRSRNVAKMLFRLPQAKRGIDHPSADAVQELAAKMPTARPTKYGNLNIQTKVLARSKRSTYLVTDEPDGQNQAISTDD